MGGKGLTEFLCGLSEAVVVLPAPRLIDPIDTARGAVGIDQALRPRTHTLVEEADYGAVFAHVPFPRRRDALWL